MRARRSRSEGKGVEVEEWKVGVREANEWEEEGKRG
jgi:hypothetical protein